MCIPSFNTPRFSASAISAAPMRHFTENAGLRLSTFANTVAPGLIKRLIRTKGVLPIASALLEYTAIPKLLGVGNC